MGRESDRQRVLILCTGNSCRSQMAEGLWRAFGGGAWEVFSAGSRPAGYVHPMATKVMNEIGIDISTHRSKGIDEIGDGPFDLVVTVCDGARESCPVFPGPVTRVHWSVEDPALAQGSEDETAIAFRRCRDELRERIRRYFHTSGAD